METFAAVLRVSQMGDRKVDDDRFHSTDDQVEDVEAWAARRGVRLDILEPELNVSGGLPIAQRPSLLQAVEGIEAGRYAGLVVAYLSRMGRNIEEQLEVWARIEAAGGEVVSVQEGIDKTTMHSTGKLQRNLLIAINTHQREQSAEGWLRRRQHATEAGIWQAPKVPRGYVKGDDRRLTPGPDAPLVHSAFAEILAGTATARQLALGPLKMSISGVRQMLRNRVYIGEVNVAPFSNPNAHPAIVERALFDAVQRKLDEGVRPGRKKTGASEPRPAALLAGLVRCASCGHLMHRGTGNERQGFSYKCRGHFSGGTCPATSSVTCKTLDRYVETIALYELERLQVEASDSVSEVRAAQETVDAAELELTSYLEAVSATEIGAEAFAAGARRRRETIEAAKDNLYAAMNRQPANAVEGTGAEVWESLNDQERNSLLRGLLDAVVIRPAGRGQLVPIEDRARVIAQGTGSAILGERVTAGRAMGCRPIPFPDVDAIGVLSVPVREDRLEPAGSAC